VTRHTVAFLCFQLNQRCRPSATGLACMPGRRHIFHINK
jgi:hypothetical protein